MRNGIDGLRALVEQTLRGDPDAGHSFVFVGKVKIPFWDRSGFVLYMKRLEKGRSSYHSSTSDGSTSRWIRRSLRCCSTGSISTHDASRDGIPRSERG